MNGSAKFILVVGIACALGGILLFFTSGPAETFSVGDAKLKANAPGEDGGNPQFNEAGNREPVENENIGAFGQKFSESPSQSSRMSGPLGVAAAINSQQTKFPAGSNPRATASESARIPGPSPSGAQAAVAGGATGPAREISIAVPEGHKVPAVFFDAEDKPLPQQKALDRIAEEFERNVSEIPPGLTQDEVWETARRVADERYLTLFGYQAYNQYHIQAAKEALKEKRGISPAP